MQHIHILAVGALREPAFAAACAEYAKRLGAFCRLSITELPEARLSKNPSEAEIRGCIRQEGAAILAKLPPKAYVCALCIEGSQLTSERFSQTLGRLADTHSHAAFVIGGSHGLDGEVKKAAHLKLSMSEMTFPHQLARVLLLEQIYRGYSILNRSRYHK